MSKMTRKRAVDAILEYLELSREYMDPSVALGDGNHFKKDWGRLRELDANKRRHDEDISTLFREINHTAKIVELLLEKLNFKVVRNTGLSLVNTSKKKNKQKRA